MLTSNDTTSKSVREHTRLMRSLDPNKAVIFHGDGEPKTPSSMLQRLAKFEDEVGIEADSYSLGGTVRQLEEKCAHMLDKEAAVFIPTGTLANHLAIRKQCADKPRAVVQEQSHLYNDTGDCVTRLSGINLIPLAKDRHYFTLAELKTAVEQAETGRVMNPVGAVMIESPVLRQSGQIVPFDQMKAITDYCRNRHIKTHLDGARLYMMSGATGIPPAEYAVLFDTVYLSLYKYLGAPFGAVLAGTAEFTEGLYHERRMFGGGLASAHFAAALALEGIDGFEQRFTQAMTQAKALFEQINTLDGICVGYFEHGSNRFPLDMASGIDCNGFVETLRTHNVFVPPPSEPDARRTMLTVNTTLLRQDNTDLRETFHRALRKNKQMSK